MVSVKSTIYPSDYSDVFRISYDNFTEYDWEYYSLVYAYGVVVFYLTKNIAYNICGECIHCKSV